MTFVFSLRCQSLLHLKLYKIQKKEWQECQKIIGEHIQKASTGSSGTGVAHSPGAAGTTAGNSSGISPTPSPAGSEGDSVCSKSSGYTSAGELSGNGTGNGNYGAPTPPSTFGAAGSSGSANGVINFSVPSNVMKTHYQLGSHVSHSHEFWEEADIRIRRGGAGGCQGQSHAKHT